MLVWLIVFEGFLVFFSAATVHNGGFLGLISSGFVFVGTLVALSRGCGNAERSFTIMLMLTAAAIGCALVQLGYTFYLLVTDKGHFTSRRRDGTTEELDRDTVRTMLIVLSLAYTCGLSIRCTVALTVYRVRKVSRNPRVMPDSREVSGLPASGAPPQGDVAVGVPVALARVLPGPTSEAVGSAADAASAPSADPARGIALPALRGDDAFQSLPHNAVPAADAVTGAEVTEWAQPADLEDGTLVLGAPVQGIGTAALGGETLEGEPVRGAPIEGQTSTNMTHE